MYASPSKSGRVAENPTPEEQEWVTKLVALHLEKMSYGAEIVELTELFFKEEIEYEGEAAEVLQGEGVPAMASFLSQVENSESFEAEDIKAMMKAVQKETGQKGKNLFMPIRVATTGQTHGPDLPAAVALLGKEVIVKRLNNVISKISK